MRSWKSTQEKIQGILRSLFWTKNLLQEISGIIISIIQTGCLNGKKSDRGVQKFHKGVHFCLKGVQKNNKGVHFIKIRVICQEKPSH